MANTSLSRAKVQKNDEFYTPLSGVENELRYYENSFMDKTVVCNCNDGEDSAFWQYFTMNFQRLGLNKLICIKYGIPSYKLQITRDRCVAKTFLQGDGDFRSDECLDILKSADIVVTNPPFSLFDISRIYESAL